MKIFITGIGTDVGKTLVSAIFVEALQADYWKPIQTGFPPHSDADTVRGLVSVKNSNFFPSAYVFKEPKSPLQAAHDENKFIDIEALTIPLTNRNLVIEGAGGVLVPITEQFSVIDLFLKFKTHIVLVSAHYLGSINHTLLTVESIRNRGIEPLGIVYSGEEILGTESFISKKTGIKTLLSIPKLKHVGKKEISELANQLRKNLGEV